MEVFVARQPIFDVKENVVAYELLFRSDNYNSCYNKDGDKATIDVLNNCFTVIGMETLTEGKRAFVNFTETLILNKVPQLLPKEVVVVEILEDVKPTEKLINECKELKKLGYVLALDDFVYDSKYDPLIPYIDIIKVDFMQNNSLDRKKIIKKYNLKNIKFLAEKIETREEFTEAVNLGYTYFQGYFFSKPVIFSGEDIEVNKISEMQILLNLKKDNLDFDELEDIIKRDIALSYKLLKVVNSPAFGIPTEITSLKQALVILGERRVYQYIYMMSLINMSSGKNKVLLESNVTRAKFGELLANKAGLDAKASDIFIMEILSNIDCFINRPLEGILSELPVSREIKEALVDKKNQLYNFHKLILSYQQGEWINFEISLNQFNINRSIIPKVYFEALKWFKNLKLAS